MAGGSPLSLHTSFHSSHLVRLLAELELIAPAPATAPAAALSLTLAERLSYWLGWTDAIPLSTALGTPVAASAAPASSAATAGTAPGASAPTAAARATKAAYERVRDELARAISQDALWTAKPSDPCDLAPYRRQIHAQIHVHQRAMTARIGPLRDRVRAALQTASADLARLAALDAVLDRTLGPREHQLLESLATRLERQLHTRPASDWGRLVHSVLLAELELRLQPIAGLIEALDASSPTAFTRAASSPSTRDASARAPRAVGQP